MVEKLMESGMFDDTTYVVFARTTATFGETTEPSPNYSPTGRALSPYGKDTGSWCAEAFGSCARLGVRYDKKRPSNSKNHSLGGDTNSYEGSILIFVAQLRGHGSHLAFSAPPKKGHVGEEHCSTVRLDSLSGAAGLRAGACVFSWGPEVSAQTQQRPNIVYILTDDLVTFTLNQMDTTLSLLATKGVTFRNAAFSDPLCCPSRVTMQRGQYPHNTGVKANNPPNGGFETFRARRLYRSTYATWLDGAGYATGYFGKYMNGYEKFPVSCHRDETDHSGELQGSLSEDERLLWSRVPGHRGGYMSVVRNSMRYGSCE